jgi:hypothetical protein
MRRMHKTLRDAGRIASCFLLIGLAAHPSQADEPQGGGRFGRLFRFGGAGSASTASSGASTPQPGHNHDTPATIKPATTTMSPSTAYATPPSPSIPPSTPPSTPDFSAHEGAGRIAPQPRVSRPPTEADPLVTRVAICRSTDGSHFASFLQVFADGTVLDGSGVHRVGGDLMKPIVDTLHQGDLYRLKGHCGTPSADFVESVHLVIYERTYGKLRASSFSYSGNPQGCDPAVRKLHTAIEALEVKLNSPTSTVPPVSTATAAPALAPTPHQPGGPVLSLTPPSP